MSILHPESKRKFLNALNNKETDMTIPAPAVLSDGQIHSNPAARVLEPWNESHARRFLGLLRGNSVAFAVPKGHPLDIGPAVAERIEPDLWTVSHWSMDGSWTATTEEVSEFGPVFAITDPATAPQDVDLSEDYWPETFTRSSRYPYTSIAYGRDPELGLLAYIRVVDTEADPQGDGPVLRWKGLTPTAPSMPDALADMLLEGFDVIVAFGDIGSNPYLADTDNAQEAK